MSNEQFGHLTVYKASAGSGKTFTLAVEYITLLLSGEGATHRHILAVTFTNKATAEMKERILEQLWKMAHASKQVQTEDGFFRAVSQRLPDVTPEELKQRAATALTEITHDYDRFRIETIDSFFQSLLTCLARELGLSSGFRVDINDKEVTERAVDRLLGELAYRPEVQKWIISYINDRIDENKRWDISGEVKDLARHLMKECFLLHDQELMAVLNDAKKIHKYRSALRSMEGSALALLKKAAEEMDAEIGKLPEGYSAFSRGSTLATFLKNIQNGELKAPGTTVSDFAQSAEKWLRKKDLPAHPEWLSAAERLQPKLKELENLRHEGSKIVNSCRLTLQHLNPLRLMGEINREVNNICEETGRFMLAKTPLLFSRLVKQADATFVFERAGTEFRHIMIDEFQDTSTLQWHNFQTLLIENMGKANSCLLVGDVKQGIYRFRNGDWNILANIDKAFAAWKPQIETLGRNFRSAENIIRFNNMFFPLAAEHIDRKYKISDISRLYADVAQEVNAQKGGFIRICVSPSKPPKGKEDSARTSDYIERDLVDQIIRLHDTGVGYEEMAILIRKNKFSPKILTYFAEHHPEIPIISDEAFLLKSSSAVLMIINAMRHLCHPDNAIALAHLVHTYRHLILKENIEWTDIAEQGETLLPEIYVNHKSDLSGQSLYELATTLISIFHPEQIEGSAPYLYCFLDSILSYLNDYNSRLQHFLTYWDETLCTKAIPADKVNGIRIITIHKSKGLAFHSVFMPYVDWDMVKGTKNELLWCEPRKEPYSEVPLIPVKFDSSAKITESIYAEQYQEEVLQRHIENLNLLYVAFTRAIQNLYVWGETALIPAQEKKESKEIASVGDLLYSVLSGQMHEEEGSYFYECGVPSVGTCKGRSEEENPLVIRPQAKEVGLSLTASRAQFRQSNAAAKFLAGAEDKEQDKQEEYISRGKLLHYIFSGIDTKTDIQGMLAQVAANGLVGKSKDFTALQRFITQRITESRAAQWFDGTWKVYNECSILSPGTSGKTVTHRPDRVMMRNGEVVVVDFKFGVPHPEYHRQVTGYCQLLRAMGHQRVCGYLWYVYSDKIVEVFSTDK